MTKRAFVRVCVTFTANTIEFLFVTCATSGKGTGGAVAAFFAFLSLSLACLV